MTVLLEALAQTALDVLMVYAVLCGIGVAAVTAWVLSVVWADRHPHPPIETEPPLEPVDFAGAIRAYRVARDEREAGERRAVR